MFNHLLGNLLDLLVGKIEVPPFCWHLNQGLGIGRTSIGDEFHHCIQPALLDHFGTEETGKHPTHPI